MKLLGLPKYHDNSSLPRKIHYLLPILFQIFIVLVSAILFRFLGRDKASGREEVKRAYRLARKNGVGVIIAANHASELDPFLIGVSLPMRWFRLPLYAVTRVKERYRSYGKLSIFFGGRLFWAGGAYPALQGIRNYEKSLPFHTKCLENRKTVLIFIEGGIPEKPFVTTKGGVGFLALKTGAIIIPTAIYGTANPSIKETFKRKHHMGVQFQKVIDPRQKYANFSYDNPQHCKDVAKDISETIAKSLEDKGYLRNKGESFEYVLP
jgi:1-acyl-sn-glycerol-3-phosphate acyltransferase